MLSINGQNPQMRLIRKATDVLKDGGVIIYPTDTVYGLGMQFVQQKGHRKNIRNQKKK